MALATLLAMLLAVTSVALGLLIGPSLQILLGSFQQDTGISARELFGPLAAPWIESFGFPTKISAASFLAYLPLFLFVIASLKFLLTTSQWLMWERLAEEWAYLCRSTLVGQFTALPSSIAIRDSEFGAQLSSVVSTDIRYIRDYIVHFYGGLPREGLQVVFLGLMSALLAPKMFLMFFFGCAPVVVIVAHIGRRLRKRAKRAMNEYQSLTEWVQLRLLNSETIKHYHTEKLETDLMQKFNVKLGKSLFRAEQMRAISSPLVEAVALIAFGLVIYWALKDTSTASTVEFSFFASLALLSQSASKLTKYFNANRIAAAAQQRIASELAYSQTFEVEDRRRFDSADQPRVVCKQLSMIYPNGKTVLENFDAVFRGGEITCIVGPSGAGKTTLLKLILGSAQATSGDILIHSPVARERSIGYLPQRYRPMLADLGANLNYPDASTDADLSELFHAIHLDEVWRSRHHILGQGSKRFSGGQEQRIGLARLLYKKFPILIVDEGTSALDPESEALIHEQLRMCADQGALVIMVSHRESSKQLADRIIELSAL